VAVRVLAALGFPCDREAGLAMLRRGLRAWNLRSPLSAFVLLLMRVLMPSFASSDVADNFAEAEAVAAHVERVYPDSALFLWIAGRLARLRGDGPRAAACLARSAGVVEWVQLAHLSAYELAWSHAFAGDWARAREPFAMLRADNEWSKAFYAYMEAVALLQEGAVSAARRSMKRAIRAFGRRLAGKVISAEQWAVRRAAEFVALTSVADGGDGGGAEEEEDVPDEAVLPAAALAAVPQLRLPARVAPCSKAHAAVLGYGAPLAALEAVYLFNGAMQMSAVACRAAIRQIDAVLAAVASGDVFDARSPAWQGTAAAVAWGADAPAWEHAGAADDDAPPPAALQHGEEAAAIAAVNALLEAAAGAPVGSLSSAEVGGEPAAAAAAASPRGGLQGFVSMVTASLTGRGAGSGGGGGGSSEAVSAASATLRPTALPAYAMPSTLRPVHVAALAALVRGAMCSRLGRVAEAGACFRFAINAGPTVLARDLHVYAYAQYELGVLYANAAKAHARRLREGAAAAAAGGSASLPAAARAHHGVDILESSLFAGLSLADLGALARRHIAAGRDVRPDFAWKLRLHLRVHLTADDLLDSLGKTRRRVLGADGAAPAMPETSEDAAKLEAHLLAAAEGPLGGDSASAAFDELAEA